MHPDTRSTAASRCTSTPPASAPTRALHSLIPRPEPARDPYGNPLTNSTPSPATRGSRS